MLYFLIATGITVGMFDQVIADLRQAQYVELREVSIVVKTGVERDILVSEVGARGIVFLVGECDNSAATRNRCDL